MRFEIHVRWDNVSNCDCLCPWAEIRRINDDESVNVLRSGWTREFDWVAKTLNEAGVEVKIFEVTLEGEIIGEIPKEDW